jgi:hypothetical protein
VNNKYYIMRNFLVFIGQVVLADDYKTAVKIGWMYKFDAAEKKYKSLFVFFFFVNGDSY